MKTGLNNRALQSRKRKSALVLIDVINDFDFATGRKLLRYALPAARRIAALRKRAAARKVPVIYVNDNFGRWQSDFRSQVAHCLEDKCLGRPVTELLRPAGCDYFVLKPKHSGFFSTSLEILLNHLEVSRLVLTGFSSDICVLYTANDAYMRDYEIVVPSDCVAAETASANQYALQQMKRCLKAEVRLSKGVRF